MPYAGVFPVHGMKFKVNTAVAPAAASLATIKDMESMSLSIDGTVEEWTPMDTEGWMRRLMTAKSFTIGLNGKRNIGDAGNDFIHGLAFKTGVACSTNAEIEFPDGAKLAFNCVVNVTNTSGGDSTNVGPLEFEFLSDGKPTYTPGV